MNIWIDLENSPHVPFFLPIIGKLEQMGHSVTITARDYAQTLDLLELEGIEYKKIGKQFGKNNLTKVIGVTFRCFQLLRFASKNKIDIAVSHGSRSMVLAAFFFRIPCLTMYDYEYVSTSIFNRFSTRVMVPQIIPDEVLQSIKLDLKRVIKYPGLKEDVYVHHNSKSEGTILAKLGVDGNSKIIATVRPPSPIGHYHDPKSEILFSEIVELISDREDVVPIVLPRNSDQKVKIQKTFAHYGRDCVIPHKAVDGLNLLWHSDLVISGGGTMAREAAVLGVPSYSIFTGKVGAVDSYLAKVGKLKLIRDVSDVHKIKMKKREHIHNHINRPSALVQFIVNEILSVGNR